jgi:ATP phosphoribosyltransferase
VKTHPRQYTAHIPAFPQVVVLFQRAQDIVTKVAEGSADLGITGFDIVCEHGDVGSHLLVLQDDLNYGHCDLVVAVPEAWMDVDSMGDVADIALDFREKKGRDLRIATQFPHLVRQFFYEYGIVHFEMVAAHGAIEAAPSLGYADIIADLTTTGTTLRENQLKPVEQGTILQSHACLIGNKRALLELVDATLEGQQYYSVTANIQGASAEEVAQRVVKEEVISGLKGPTIAPVYSHDRIGARWTGWYAVTIIVHRADLLHAVAHLRTIRGAHIIVTPVDYVFFDTSRSCYKLRSRLKREKASA